MHRAVAVGLLLTCVVVGSVAGTTAQTETATANDSSVRHVNPSEAGSTGDLGALESYLQRQLAGRLARSQMQISQGRYQRGKSLVGDEYRDLLAKYVDVEGETAGGDESNDFRKTARDQREFADDVQSYRETYDEYQEAERNGNEQRARDLARDLERRSRNVQQTGGNLSTSYRRLGNATGQNFTDTRDSVNATVANVTAQQEQVRDAEFTRTNLTVTADSEAVSFYLPLELEGRIETENGTALAEREVTIQVGTRRFQVDTDEEGEFTLTYRPVRLPLDTDELRVQYRPANESVYVGAEAAVPVAVEQVDPGVSVSSATDEAAYGVPVAATARVTADEQPVTGARVGLFVEGQRLATGRTDAEGEVDLGALLPAEVATGERTVSVRVLGENRAVGPANASRPFDVKETATTLSVTAAPADDGVRLGGRLTTADAEPVAGRSVAIRRNDSLVTTVQTGRDGQFTATVPAEPGGRHRFAAVYDEPSTNLGPSQARTSLTLPGPGQDGSMGADSLSALVDDDPYLVAGGVLLALLLLAVAGRAVREWLGGDEVDEGGPPVAGSAEAEPATDAANDESTDPVSAARELIDENASAAVERAYHAVRSRLHDRGIASADATHRELYWAGRDAGVDTDDLETLTQAYERAAFAPRKIDLADARSAVDAAGRLT